MFVVQDVCVGTCGAKKEYDKEGADAFHLQAVCFLSEKFIAFIKRMFVVQDVCVGTCGAKKEIPAEAGIKSFRL